MSRTDTTLARRLGDQYAEILATHRALLRAAFAAHEGYEVDTQGDSFFVVFSRATQAVAAAVAMQRALAAEAWPEGGAVRVRIGMHTRIGGRTSSRGSRGNGGSLRPTDPRRALPRRIDGGSAVHCSLLCRALTLLSLKPSSRPLAVRSTAARSINPHPEGAFALLQVAATAQRYAQTCRRWPVPGGRAQSVPRQGASSGGTSGQRQGSP